MLQQQKINFGAKIQIVQFQIVAIQIFRETEVLQFGKNHIRTCALKLSCYIFKIIAYVTQWTERV